MLKVNTCPLCLSYNKENLHENNSIIILSGQIDQTIFLLIFLILINTILQYFDQA